MANSSISHMFPSVYARHVHLLKRCLTDTIHAVTYAAWLQPSGALALTPLPEGQRQQIDEGKVWPAYGETMIGFPRLDNIQFCVEDILKRGVPGDFIEAGVWRGGAGIFIKSLLELNGETARGVWLANSFAGPPTPDLAAFPADAASDYGIPFLAVSEPEVRANFRRYGLDDQQVHMVKGYFKNTLSHLADQNWALIRLDANLYESTMDGLVNLYPRLAAGGYIILDDYGCCRPCREAVDDFRRRHAINDEINTIDWTGVYWRKSH